MRARDEESLLKHTSDLIAATTTCFLGLDPWVALECLRSAGIRYAEVPALPGRLSVEWRQTTFSPETLGPDGTQRLRERLAEMELVPITVGAYASVLEPADFEPLLRRIDFAQQLGASFVIVDAAGEEPDGAAAWRRVGNLGRFLGDYAEARGVRLAFEIHEGLAHSGAAARRLLDAIDHPAVGVNYDTGNAIYYNDAIDPVADLQAIVDRVIHVHLKDTSGGRGEWAFGPLGSGHVDLPTIVSLLKSLGFRGPYSLEIEGYAGEDLTRERRIQRVRDSLSYLSALGIGQLPR
jgi:sugar phosphate isomerase/epimerase